MKIASILLCTVALSLAACSSYNHSATGPRYMPRPEIANHNYSQQHYREDYIDKKSYREYEQRELCQNYRELPRHSIDNCNQFKSIGIDLSQSTEVKQTLLPIVRSYTVLFDFDKSSIRADGMEQIRQAIREIEKYNPEQVTVTGYTDSAGKAGYNQTLSHLRELAVSRALLNNGVNNQTIKREARGEYDQAVDTLDGTRNQENRRVVIDFRRKDANVASQ